jgi:hypothetical protein
MSRRTYKYIAFISVMIILFAAAFASASTAEANGPIPWTGKPDPYACNVYLDCWWTVTVCINGITYEVGIYYDPATSTKKDMEKDALGWSGIKLKIGKCGFSYTGRWVHTYIGRTWTCNLISEASDDKNDPRFSNIDYVKAACGDHPLFGPFEGTADYKLCREKHSKGRFYCGNHYDTSY